MSWRSVPGGWSLPYHLFKAHRKCNQEKEGLREKNVDKSNETTEICIAKFEPPAKPPDEPLNEVDGDNSEPSLVQNPSSEAKRLLVEIIAEYCYSDFWLEKKCPPSRRRVKQRDGTWRFNYSGWSWLLGKVGWCCQHSFWGQQHKQEW